MFCAVRTDHGPRYPLVAAILLLSAGCSSPEQDTLADATALLARYEQGRQVQDPQRLSEVELGEFTVTQRREPAIYFIRFRLWAVVPDKEVPEFTRLLQTHGERIRGEVREIVQGSDLDQLDDPALVWMKLELVQSINRRIQATLVRDVVFAEFSFERG
jgi:hypothetical protein